MVNIREGDQARFVHEMGAGTRYHYQLEIIYANASGADVTVSGFSGSGVGTPIELTIDALLDSLPEPPEVFRIRVWGEYNFPGWDENTFLQFHAGNRIRSSTLDPPASTACSMTRNGLRTMLRFSRT